MRRVTQNVRNAIETLSAWTCFQSLLREIEQSPNELTIVPDEGQFAAQPIPPEWNKDELPDSYAAYQQKFDAEVKKIHETSQDTGEKAEAAVQKRLADAAAAGCSVCLYVGQAVPDDMELIVFQDRGDGKEPIFCAKPSFAVSIAHELIHARRMLKGESLLIRGEYSTQPKRSLLWSPEEEATVGDVVRSEPTRTRPRDLTENMVRWWLQQPQRLAYEKQLELWGFAIEYFKQKGLKAPWAKEWKQKLTCIGEYCRSGKTDFREQPNPLKAETTAQTTAPLDFASGRAVTP